jgi:hypothetical protein
MEGLLLKVLHLLVHHGHPPRPSATSTADGRGPSDLIVTGRWDADGIGRGRPPYKWKTLPTFLLTSVGELGTVSLTSHAPPEAIH